MDPLLKSMAVIPGALFITSSSCMSKTHCYGGYIVARLSLAGSVSWALQSYSTSGYDRSLGLAMSESAGVVFSLGYQINYSSMFQIVLSILNATDGTHKYSTSTSIASTNYPVNALMVFQEQNEFMTTDAVQAIVTDDSLLFTFFVLSINGSEIVANQSYIY